METLNEEEARRRAYDFLMDVSSDECWIDASGGFARNRLATLLMDTFQEGLRLGRDLGS